MKILFVDETDRQRSSDDKYYFMLCGLILDSDALVLIMNELKSVTEKYKITNLKVTRGKIDKNKKIKMTEEIAYIFKKYDVKILSICLGGYTLKNTKEPPDRYLGALDFLLERFFIRMNQKNEIGIVILDSVNPKLQNKLKDKYYEHVQKSSASWASSGKIIGYYKDRLFSDLLFSDDKYNILLQVTDLVAVALNNAMWKSFEEGDFNIDKLYSKNEYLNLYWPFFAKNPDTKKVDGWGIKFWN
jgi:hypothetical protein